MIAGAPKSGTTSLKEYLAQHPRIRTHEQREMPFFTSDEEYARGWDEMSAVYFPSPSGEELWIGKSVALMYSDDGLVRLRNHNPGVHVVVSLREPVERAYSEYWYARRRGWEDARTFEGALRGVEARAGPVDPEDRRPDYLARSRYAPRIRALHEHFSASHVHVLLLDELRRDPQAVCTDLFRLLPGVDPSVALRREESRNTSAFPRWELPVRLLASGRTLPWIRSTIRRLLGPRRAHRARNWLQGLLEADFSPPPMRPETKERLTEEFQSWNLELGHILGRDLKEWNG